MHQWKLVNRYSHSSVWTRFQSMKMASSSSNTLPRLVYLYVVVRFSRYTHFNSQPNRNTKTGAKKSRKRTCLQKLKTWPNMVKIFKIRKKFEYSRKFFKKLWETYYILAMAGKLLEISKKLWQNFGINLKYFRSERIWKS